MSERAGRTEGVMKKHFPNRESAISPRSSYRLIGRALLVLGGAGLLFVFPFGTVIGVALILIGAVLL